MTNIDKLLSIQIRDITLHLDRYYLLLKTDNQPIIQTHLTKLTIFPQFNILKPLKEISPLFKFNSTIPITLTLYGTNSKPAIVEFSIDMKTLTFIGENLIDIRIHKYPIIIFEYSKGYYTTKELAMNCLGKIPEEPKRQINNINYASLLAKKKEYEKSKVLFEQNKKLYEDKLDEIDSLKTPMYNQYIYIQTQLKLIKRAENRLGENNNTYYLFTTFADIFRTMIEEQKKKVVNLELMIKDNQAVNESKKKRLMKLKEEHNFSKWITQQFMKKSIFNLEYCFFNENIMHNAYYYVPFYKDNYNDNQITRLSHYSKQEKDMSYLLGTMIQISYYLSTIFNIPLRHSLSVQGSKSSLYSSHTFSIKMNNLSQSSIYDQGLNYLKIIIKELSQYFSTKTELINDERKSIQEDNLFIIFIQFNQFIHDYLNKRNENDSDIIFK